MPYHKDKQQAFQAAQQGTEQVIDIFQNIVHITDPNYGLQLHHLKQEVNEAYEQIKNALEVASSNQRAILEQYQEDLQRIVREVNEID